MKTLARNIPNILSAYRLLTFPLLLWLIWKGERNLFIVLLSINLITDILDGLIARTFKLSTEFGAKLDSLADITTHIAAFTAFFVLERDFVMSHLWAFVSIFALWMIPQIVCLLRFRHNPHLHLYSNKIAGYFQGIFIFTYFNWGNSDLYFYTMWTVTILAFLEELVVVAAIPALRSNVKGIYWMVKENGKIA